MDSSRRTARARRLPAWARGFAPVALPSARVLVLGSLPGRRSIEEQRYYAHPRNAFWPIVDALLGVDAALPYERRTQRLASAGVALWDVLAAASRSGSADATIEVGDAEPNAFVEFFAAHPRIGCVFFNGTTAASLYRRRVLPLLPEPLAALARRTLPSTSPAHASMRFDEKLERWAALRDALQRRRR